MNPTSRSSRHPELRDISCILAAALLAISIAPRVLADPTSAHSIDSVRAHFYYQKSGTFSESDLFDPKLVLRNTRIGEGGDAKEPSGAVLVLVKMSGSFLAGTKGSIELRSSAAGHNYPRQSIPLHTLFSESGTATAPFLIYDSPCSPLALEFLFVGVAGDPVPVTRTIPFHCGE